MNELTLDAFKDLMLKLDKFYPDKFDRDRKNNVWVKAQRLGIPKGEFQMLVEKFIWASRSKKNYHERFELELEKKAENYIPVSQERFIEAKTTCLDCFDGWVTKYDKKDRLYAFRCSCLYGNMKSQQIPVWENQCGFFNERK